jgi:hypothetical protein
VTLIVIHCNVFDSYNGGIFKAAAQLSALLKVYTIPCHDRGHINVMLVLQSCTDSLRRLPGSSCETFPTSSDGTYDVSNIKVEKDIDIKEENVIAEEECIDIKDEEGLYSEEEEEEDIDTKEDEDENIKVEVSCEGTV